MKNSFIIKSIIHIIIVTTYLESSLHQLHSNHDDSWHQQQYQIQIES
jgi:hypothetical protein